jgi:N-acetylneuraminic acid mutarotase
MKKKRATQFGSFNPQLVLCLVSVCSIITGTLLAFFRPEASAKASQTTLTFAERVAYQRAIEEVYWRHRIWPRSIGGRSDPKPSLDAVMSQAQIESKVQHYLRNSQALEEQWQRPLTSEQLQAEMYRMAKNTKQPEMLGELFEALGNDPSIIAECLGRPVLTERLTAELAPQEKTRPFGSAQMKRLRRLPVATGLGNVTHTLPKLSRGVPPCTNDTWTVTSITNAPSPRLFHTAVWTGSEMIVWGGDNGGQYLNTGGRYDPTTDSWAATSNTNAPSARPWHTAVWTGDEMIVWGGGTYTNSGGRYNPGTDTWTATSSINAPSARAGHTAVWTGSEMIIWGGYFFDGFHNHYFNTGGRYDPDTDTWTSTSTSNAPTARAWPTGVWTGSEMIAWGGSFDDGVTYFSLNTGGRYNPTTNSWTTTSTTNVADARQNHTAVWTNDEMIVWGGDSYGFGRLNTGGVYSPSSDTWTATTLTSAPEARYSHTAVWTGSEMIAWGGFATNTLGLKTGGRYNPTTNSWMATTTTNAPDSRYDHTAIWDGSEMIVWGGYGASYLNTGGRYCAQSGPSPTPTATATATPTPCTGRCSPTPRPHPSPHPRP